MYGRNIICSEDQQWAKYRKACATSFNEKNLQYVWESSVRLMQEVFTSWADRQEVRLPVVQEFTLNVCT